jgi:hypothetical protein
MHPGRCNSSVTRGWTVPCLEHEAFGRSMSIARLLRTLLGLGQPKWNYAIYDRKDVIASGWDIAQDQARDRVVSWNWEDCDETSVPMFFANQSGVLSRANTSWFRHVADANP